MGTPNSKAVLHAGLALAVILLAGCTTGDDEMDGSNIAQVGEGVSSPTTGTKSASTQCDEDGMASFGAAANSGSVRYRVTDASGTVLADSGNLGPGSSGSSSTMEGTPGTWTLRVDLLAFTGSYSGSIVC